MRYNINYFLHTIYKYACRAFPLRYTIKRGTYSSVQPVSEINFEFSQQMRLPGIYYLLVEGKNLSTALKLMRQ